MAVSRKAEKTCPKCGFTGNVLKQFGTRKNPNEEDIPQSWCNLCRRGKERVVIPTARYAIIRLYKATFGTKGKHPSALTSEAMRAKLEATLNGC